MQILKRDIKYTMTKTNDAVISRPTPNLQFFMIFAKRNNTKALLGSTNGD
jgi:hypothetical protein